MVKLLIKTPASHIRGLGSSPSSSFLLTHTVGGTGDGLSGGWVPATPGKTHVELLAPSLHPRQGLLQVFGEWTSE